MDNLDSIIYGIDPDGYLVDSEGYYIVDSKKETIKLTVSQINRLHEAGLTSKINSWYPLILYWSNYINKWFYYTISNKYDQQSTNYSNNS